MTYRCKENSSVSDPNFYAVIPAVIRYHKTLSDGAKLLYGEVASLCNAEGYCWASNQYFAQRYNRTKGTISRWITELRDLEFINTDFEDDNNRKIYLTPITPTSYTPIIKNRETPIIKNREHNIKEENIKETNSLSAVNAIVDLFLSLGTNLKKPRLKNGELASEAIRKDICKCLRVAGWKETFEEAVKHANRCSFAQGNNDRSWKVSLRWMVENSKKVDRVLDWKIDQKDLVAKPIEQPADDKAKEEAWYRKTKAFEQLPNKDQLLENARRWYKSMNPDKEPSEMLVKLRAVGEWDEQETT